MREKRTFPQLCAAVYINDVIPRERKHGFPPSIPFVTLLVAMEFAEAITRKRLRQFLDDYYDDIKNGLCCRPAPFTPKPRRAIDYDQENGDRNDDKV